MHGLLACQFCVDANATDNQLFFFESDIMIKMAAPIMVIVPSELQVKKKLGLK